MSDHASDGDVMREYARQRGLKRVMISIPLLTPRLSSLWQGLVTPVYARVCRELIEKLKSRSFVTGPAALATFPVRPVGLREAKRAIPYENRAFALTRCPTRAPREAARRCRPTRASAEGWLTGGRSTWRSTRNRAFAPCAGGKALS